MTIESVWVRLSSLCELSFNATSSSSTGWTGTGVGTVNVSQPTSTVLVSSESGTWSPQNGQPLGFTNVYRWTRLSESIRLEHLRFGANNPVYLFELGIVDEFQMKSIDPHV